MDPRDEQILQFLDSVDSYISRYHHLSFVLRQGWLDIASARHSMGSSRISSALYDLKEHQAASVLQINEWKDKTDQGASYYESSAIWPHFRLVKWGSYEHRHQPFGDEEMKGMLEGCSSGSDLRHRDFFGAQEIRPSSRRPLTTDSQVEKLRSKSLSIFGALVTPKLRSVQLSFETALEMLVEIANAQSVMQLVFDRLQQNKASASDNVPIEEAKDE